MNSNDKKLLSETDSFVKEEKKFTLKILQNLKIIDAKKLFVELGYSSLFEYCKENLHYSDQEAAIRVNAMRLMRDLPLVQEKIECGLLNLTNAGNLFSDMKKYERESGKKLSSETKNSLVSKISGLSTREARSLVQDELNLKQVIKDNSVDVKLQKRIFDRLEKLKEKLNIQDLNLLLDTLMQEKEDSLVKATKTTLAPESAEVKKSRYIPVKLKRAIFKEANYRCQYVNQSGKRCNTHTYLTIEHSYPFAYGGNHHKDNLSLLCFQHNQYKFLKFKNDR